MTDLGSRAIARLCLGLSRTGSRIVPLSLATAFAAPVAETVSHFAEGNRRVAMRNFAHVLGRPMEDPVVARTARNCFRHFGRYGAEVIHVQGWGTDNVLDRLEIEGAENFDTAEAHGRGIIFVSGHMGATEVGAAMALLRGYDITSVAERIHPEWLYQYLLDSRERIGIKLLPVGGAGIPLLRTLRRSGMVAFVVDAGITRGGAVPVTFFGRETLFPEGPARIARLSGAPIVFGVTVRLPGNRYRAYVYPPLTPERQRDADGDVRDLTQRIATLFEGVVRRHPSQWYAFREMWPNAGVSSRP